MPATKPVTNNAIARTPSARSLYGSGIRLITAGTPSYPYHATEIHERSPEHEGERNKRQSGETGRENAPADIDEEAGPEVTQQPLTPPGPHFNRTATSTMSKPA